MQVLLMHPAVFPRLLVRAIAGCRWGRSAWGSRDVVNWDALHIHSLWAPAGAVPDPRLCAEEDEIIEIAEKVFRAFGAVGRD